VQYLVVHLPDPVDRQLETHGTEPVHAELTAEGRVRVEGVDVLLAEVDAAAPGVADQVVHEIGGATLW
jgi:hypothetical protein